MIDAAAVRRLAVDWAPSLVLAGVGGHELLYNAAPAWQWLTGFGIVLLLGLRRRLPLPVLVGTLVLATPGWIAGDLLVVHLGLLVALHAVAWRSPRRSTVVSALVVEAAAVYVAARVAPAGSTGDGIVLATGLVLTAVVLGTAQHTQQRYLAALEDRAEQLRRERNQKAEIAAAEERTRIAREIHDIVAHSVSVMIALSEGAARTPDDVAARGSMRQVAATGREALSELRRVLSVLYTGDGNEVATGEVGERAPQPMISSLDAVLRDVELAGLRVDMAVEGDATNLAEGLQATVFRIVQESLTNTLKHAEHATRADVRIAVDDAHVAVEVADDGRCATRTPARPEAGAGNGVRGMGERARMYDGDVTAGPKPDGSAGWVVQCVLHREVTTDRDPSPAR